MTSTTSSQLLLYGPDVMARIDTLARFSSEPGKLTRLYLTPEHKAAALQVKEWMEQAGMVVRLDAIGNVVGRYEGERSGLPALILGSHIDTVPDAGKYDGILGVVAAIACVETLHQAGEHLPFAIEVIGFGDEEGVRFPTSMSGSRAVAGLFDPASLERRDADGISLAEALHRFGLDPSGIGAVARRPDQVLGYVELHIEQGPVLDAEGYPIGVVTSIAGASRFAVEVTGVAGHAGTVPMSLRHDALATVAEAVLAVERRCQSESAELVGTVGQLNVLPGAANVIPGWARFPVDIRAADDPVRRAAKDDIVQAIKAVGARRGVRIHIVEAREVPACACAPELMDQLQAAAAAQGVTVRRLPSGAMHDAMQLARLTDAAMLFVRCKAGVSHNPAEAISVEDADLGVRILLSFIRRFRPGTRFSSALPGRSSE